MRSRIPLLLPCLGLLLAAGCARRPPGGSVERRVALMGTVLHLRVEAPGRAAAAEASEAAVRALEAAEARLSTWRPDSELARLNGAAPDQPFAVSPALHRELSAAQRWWRDTGGAFDPGVGALVEAWGLREGGRLPAPAERAAALAAGGLASLEILPGAAVRRHPALRLEEGGFGKGAGLDAALEALRQAGARRGFLDLGGQVAVFGPGRPFPFALADPRDRRRPVLRIAVPTGSFATSGNSEHGIVVDGVRYGHLLDPRSGAPAPDFGSLTVWAPDATAADCLSTGLYVMGPDAALRWVRGRTGLELVVIEPDGSRLRARATSGLRGRLEPLVRDLDLEFAGGGPGG